MNTGAVGYVKQILRCPEKSINFTNRMKILQSRSDRGTHYKTFRHWKLRTFSVAVATSPSEYFTVKHITKKLICCLSWSSREDCSADLVPEIQKLPKLSSHNEYDRTGGYNYYLSDNSKIGAKFGVLYSLEDHDFNRAIHLTTQSNLLP